MNPPGPPDSPDSTTLVLRRTFAAPRQRVFRAWIEPAALEQWWRPRGMRVKVRSLDARVGGSLWFELENGTSMVGTYLEFLPPERLVFTWAGDAAVSQRTVVTVEFLDRGPLTEIVLTHEGLTAPEMRARVMGGWPSMFDALAAMLVSPPVDS